MFQIILLSNICVIRSFLLRSSTRRVDSPHPVAHPFGAPSASNSAVLQNCHFLRKKDRIPCSWSKIIYLETTTDQPWRPAF
ncbi:MAG: PilI type IV pilus biogenesis protein [Deltaproteobacteria bacterium]|nr:PilI type IV pilus biogenesis protein [Deltaproteobacteria bacterium]